ncbi:MAG: hypothetical protein IJJ23_03185, partial [Clostridia bacterium]|nr:hypothetical protein [Clostridia bacterium]
MDFCYLLAIVSYVFIGFYSRSKVRSPELSRLSRRICLLAIVTIMAGILLAIYPFDRNFTYDL